MKWLSWTLLSLSLHPVTQQTSVDRMAITHLIDKAGEHLQAARDVLVIRRRESRTAEEKQRQFQEWMGQGLVSRKEFEDVSAAWRGAHDAVTAQQTLCSALEGLLAELDSGNALSTGEGGKLPTSGWNLDWFPHLLNHFWHRFEREMPISAMGQTPTHKEMGLDHRDRVDVALHPSSPEGLVVIRYLEAKGYPFTAFRSSVPGVATGAHIHIGPGSLQRLP